MQVREVRPRPENPPAVAWGAGFVDALRQVWGVAPVSRISGPAATSGSARPAAPNSGDAAPRRPPSLWERLVGWVRDVVRGALDLLRVGLETFLQALGGR
mgnify:FL=1